MDSMVHLLDCTLRDGAHLNHGLFGKKTIEDTITGLVNAKMDIVEIGFFNNDSNSEDSSFFSSIAEAKKVLPTVTGNTRFSLMADYVDVDNIEPCDGTIEFFRLSFKRQRLSWGLEAARKLMAKGYKCYINPVNCTVYTDEEYLQVIKQVNELKPYGFSMVDTFGVMRKETLSRFYYLLEGNLDPDITIGLHLHENLGLAYSLAQHFLEIRNPKRRVTIDCSLLGMGRVPGNLCTEQIMDHLNIYMGCEYNTEPALDVIDDYIAPLKQEMGWGYSIPYALSGKYGVHRTYAEFLMGKHRLRTKDIQRILSSIDSQHIEMFDQEYIESLYRHYVEVECDNTAATNFLTEVITEKKVLVVCPGHSIVHYRESLRAFAAQEDVAVFSVNFAPDFADVDVVFCANAKRFANISEVTTTTRLITSNLMEIAHGQYDYVYSFNNCVYFNETFCEDSTVMLLKILSQCNCKEVYVAGFDGFVEGAENYYHENYTREKSTTANVRLMKKVMAEALGGMVIHFLTPSIYVNDLMSQ